VILVEKGMTPPRPREPLTAREVLIRVSFKEQGDEQWSQPIFFRTFKGNKVSFDLVEKKNPTLKPVEEK